VELAARKMPFDAYFQAYVSYCVDPRLERIDDVLRSLFACSVDPSWEEESQRFLDVYLSTPSVSASRTFITNQLIEYRFGPFDERILTTVEGRLEEAKEDHVVVNVNPQQNVVGRYYVAINPFSEDWESSLFRYFYWNPSIRRLYAQPSCLIFLLRSQRIVDYLRDGGVGVISTGEPMMFNRSLCSDIYLNDKMINWRSGLNFWTCRHGGSHWLPLFTRRSGRLYNLLNLADKSGIEEDDLHSLEPGDVCRCGVRSGKVNVVSHYRNSPVRRSLADVQSLFNRLEGTYFNFQYIETTDGSHLLYTALKGNDESILREWSDCRLWPGSFMKVGRKRPAIWKMSSFSPVPYSEERYWMCRDPVVMTF
jgi:hypothetical protein